MKFNLLLISLISLIVDFCPACVVTLKYSPHDSEPITSDVSSDDEINRNSASSSDVPVMMKQIDEGYVINNYYFFYNLQENYPTNSVGECTWVAATMYLSYMNTFYSPTIKEEYIVRSIGTGTDFSSYAESPGVLDSYASGSFYGDFVNKYKSSFTYPVLQYMPTVFTSYSEQANLINQYLTDYGYVEKTDYTIFEDKSVLNISSVYNTIISLLQSGQPVIANTPKHSFVVYGYVPNTKKLLVHNGWKSSPTLMEFNDDGSEQSPGIQYIVYVNFLSHIHNYLYVDSSNSTAYCSCGDDVYTYPYYHKHVMEIIRQGKKITFRCSICGYTQRS